MSYVVVDAGTCRGWSGRDHLLRHGAARIEGRRYESPARALAAARRANGGEWPTYVVVRDETGAAGEIQLSDTPRGRI